MQQPPMVELTVNQVQQVFNSKGLLAAYNLLLTTINTNHLSDEVISSTALSATFENQLKMSIEVGQSLSQLKLVVSEYLKTEEKKHKKRAANRKSASISRSRKKKFIERLTIENNKLKKINRLLAASPDLVFSLSGDGHIKYVSWRTQKILSYSHDLEGKKFVDYISPQKKSFIENAIASLYSTAINVNVNPGNGNGNTFPPCSGNNNGDNNGNDNGNGNNNDVNVLGSMSNNLSVNVNYRGSSNDSGSGSVISGAGGDSLSINTEETNVKKFDSSPLYSNTCPKKEEEILKTNDSHDTSNSANSRGPIISNETENNDCETVDGNGSKLLNKMGFNPVEVNKAKELAEQYDRELANMSVEIMKSDGTVIPCSMRVSVLLPKTVCQTINGFEDFYLSDDEGGTGTAGITNGNEGMGGSQSQCTGRGSQTPSANFPGYVVVKGTHVAPGSRKSSPSETIEAHNFIDSCNVLGNTGNITDQSTNSNRHIANGNGGAHQEEEEWEHAVGGGSSTVDDSPEIILSLRPLSLEHHYLSDSSFFPILCSLGVKPQQDCRHKDDMKCPQVEAKVEVESKKEMTYMQDIYEESSMKADFRNQIQKANTYELSEVNERNRKRSLNEELGQGTALGTCSPDTLNTTFEGKEFQTRPYTTNVEDTQRPCKAPKID
jgi:PAS domain-containing protein